MPPDRPLIGSAAGLLLLLTVLFPALAVHSQVDKDFHIKHFNVENGLPQNSVKTMEFDYKGYLWLITESGLLRFDGRNFHAYNKLKDGSLLRERPRIIYLSPDSGIIVQYEKDQFFRPAGYDSLKPVAASAGMNSVYWRAPDLTQDFIYNECFRKVEQKEQLAFILPYMRDDMLRTARSFTLYGNSFYWINLQQQLISSDTSLRTFQKLRLSGLPPLHDAFAVTRVIWDKENLYLQWGDYIASLQISNNGREAVVTDLIYTGNIGMVTTVKKGKHRNIYFIGTITDGLFQFTRKEFATRIFARTYNNIFCTQAPIGDSDVVTEKGIITKGQPPTLSDFRSSTLLKLKNGNFILNKWFSKNDNSLIFFDNNFTRITSLKSTHLTVTCMFQSADERVWICTEENFMGELKNGKINWRDQPDKQKPFIIQSIQEAAPGIFWIADVKQLALYNVNTYQLQPVDGMNDKYIRTLYLDSTGVLWIGTYGNGFYALQNGSITQFPADAGGFMESVHAFMEDSKGYLWMSTNKGLFQAKTSDLRLYMQKKTNSLYYHYYDVNNGFLTNEFNGGCFPSAIRTGNGLFSFPSMKGLVQFDPQRINPIRSVSQLYIDRILADSVLIPVISSQLNLPSGIHRLQFSISSPFFGNPYNHQIQYQLAGADSSWMNVPGEGNITFERLPAGNYILLLRKKNGFGNNMATKSILITIEPAFHETVVFRLGLMTFLLVMMWLIVRLRTHFLLLRQKKLENEVAYRTGEQQKLIRQLESTVQNLEISRNELARHSRLMEFLSVTITHDLQSPLRFFSDVSATLHEKAISFNDQATAALSGELLNASRSTHRFVQDFGNWIKSLGSGFSLQKNDINLYELLDKTGRFITEQLRQKENSLYLDCAPDLIIQTDRQLLQIIIRNLLDNANKHTKNGDIRISASVSQTQVTITISDTGRGFTEESLSRVRKITEESFNSLSELKGSNGYGYYFIGDFCKLLGISINISNGQEKGAIITLTNIQLFHS